MSPLRTAFFCGNCGYQASKWLGRCPSCGAWNTFTEEVLQKDKTTRDIPLSSKPFKLEEVPDDHMARHILPDNELNRVLGGGVVPGSLILLGGEPGMGKSTLMLQLALSLDDIKVLYVSGEESLSQIKMRAQRIGLSSDNLFLMSSTRVVEIIQQSESLKPGLIIADSIQTLVSESIDSAAGSISQIRESATELQKLAKSRHSAVFLVGHITKEGQLAGPKLLEHMVDTVLQFEGDRNYGFRILRTMKNRFGSTSELGIYEMHSGGLRQVSNPSEILLSQRDEQMSGISIAATLEGRRPLLVETQALVTPSAFGSPQRSVNGFDQRRLNMLLAVLEKRTDFNLAHKDVFLNIAGGIQVDDPAIDLSVITAVLSSNEDIPVSYKYCFSAEVGLAGEIRGVSQLEVRIAEAAKLGFEKIFIAAQQAQSVEAKKYHIRVIPVKHVMELASYLFG